MPFSIQRDNHQLGTQVLCCLSSLWIVTDAAGHKIPIVQHDCNFGLSEDNNVPNPLLNITDPSVESSEYVFHFLTFEPLCEQRLKQFPSSILLTKVHRKPIRIEKVPDLISVLFGFFTSPSSVTLFPHIFDF